jgi:lysophospholipid acyltransferase (LPLAT)-like uncharacterized protein
VKITNPWAVKSVALAGSSAIRAWMSTLDIKGAFYDPAIDPAHPDCQGRRIWVFWHEYILLPLYVRGHCNLAMLLSRHRDAEFLARIAGHMGFECVRGSTFAGGGAALRELGRKAEKQNLVITPDGPRGPRRRLAQGCVFLASTLGLPIVAMGLGYDRPWRLNSWDRFAIPRPNSRARGCVSPEMRIPPNLDRHGIEHYRLQVEAILNRLTLEAEAWAESDTSKVEQIPVRREPARDWRRFDVAHEPKLDLSAYQQPLAPSRHR